MSVTEHRRNVRKEEKEVNTKKEKTPVNKFNLISKIIMGVFTALVLTVFGLLIFLNVLPMKYLIPLFVVALGLNVAGVIIVFKTKNDLKLRFIITVVAAVGALVLGFVTAKLFRTVSFLKGMETETVNSKTYYVVVLNDGKYNKLEDLQYKLLMYYDTELSSNQTAMDKLNEALVVVSEKTDDVHELAEKLIAKEVDAVLLEDSHYAIIEEEIEDFRTKTKSIYEFSLEDVIETIAKEVSVTEEPFNIFISGIDAYGKISSVARSDVNMVASVNPKTKQVLLINIPRDYYVKLHGTSGYRDKLTHAGIYGINMSVKTVEDLLGIDINYYVRVNFTSLIDIINAIGGVEVYSKYTFTSRIGKYKFVEGYNKMNGKQALGFARERYSFQEGDRMRGQNQQAVIDAVIKKVCSSSTILTRFDALLDSLEGSFQTNMDYTKMVELVRMQITDGASWNVSSIGIDGAGSMERTYSMGKRLLSVLIPYSGSVKQASALINKTLDGELLEAGNIDLSKYNDYLVVQPGNYPKDEVKEEVKEEIKEPETQVPEDTTTDTPTTPDTNTGTDSGETNTPTTPDTNTGTDNGGTSTPTTPDTNTGTDNGGTSTPTTPDTNTGTDSGETNTPTTPDTNTGTDNGGANTPTTPENNTGSGENGGTNTPTTPGNNTEGEQSLN